MSYYILPILPSVPNLHKFIDVKFCSKNVTGPIISTTLFHYLSDAKRCIDTNQLAWDKYKKYTNPYEYIHTVVPGLRQSVCRMKPLSRSFFKMVEICHVMQLLDGLGPRIKTFHLAEGPGGFIEAMALLRNNREDIYQGITLVDDNNSCVPGWKKSQTFLEQTPNVVVETGISGTGDLTLPENLRDFYDRHHGTCDIVSGDGGFDFTTDFEHQETMSTKLIMCQIAFAVACQAKGGSFVLKVFDTFTASSIDLLYLLGMMYNNVHIFKPYSSRVANSEKYIVCKGFRIQDTRKLVITLFHAMQHLNDGECIKRVISFEPSYAFKAKLEEYNAIIGQQQIESITQTLALIGAQNLERLETLKWNNIQKCTSWCQKHKLQFNRMQAYQNQFSRKDNSFLRERALNVSAEEY